MSPTREGVLLDVGSDDGHRTAHHEAGHAIAAGLFGHTLTLVSIGPGAAYGGIRMFDKAPTDAPAVDASVPALLQPSETRVLLEQAIVTSLVGPITGGFLEIVAGYRQTENCEVDAESAAAGVGALSPGQRSTIVEQEADATELVGDEASASRLSWAFIGEASQATMYLAWPRRRPKPEPPETLMGPGGPALPEELTLDHPHAVVADDAFVADFIAFAGRLHHARPDARAPGHARRRSLPLVKRHRDRFRRTPAVRWADRMKGPCLGCGRLTGIPSPGV